MTGNVIDLAIAVILAGAIGSVIKGFVSFIMMPIIGMFIGGASLAEKFVELTPYLPAVVDDAGEVIEKAIPANNLMYGAWIDTVISLIIIGFVLFLVVKAYNKSKKKVEAAPAVAPKPTVDQDLLVEIRDLLKK